MQPSQYPTEIINQLIRNRRSVLLDQFTGERVDDSIVKQMLENANWAPNHGRTEPWRFFVFTGEGLKQLGEFQANLYKEITPADKFDEANFNKLKSNPLKASHIIAIAMKRQESGKIPEIEEVEAVACAVQNMYLTATAYGVGGYWGSGGVTYKEEAKEFFGLGTNDKLLGFFYLGVPKSDLPDGKRTSIDEKVTWIAE
jgi:nitroreductase